MLILENISKTFVGADGPVRALDGVSLKLDRGDFLAIRGPSGCGKSTLLLSAGGLLRPDTGRVLIENQDLYSISHEGRCRLRATTIGFVFQRFHLVPYLSVLDNVLAPSLALGRNDAHRRAGELIERFGLASRMHHLPSQLSTGERQRTALARAMLNNPRLILADEPTGNLDPDNGTIVLKCLADFAASGGAVLLVTHDPDAANFAKQSLSMAAGRLPGTAAEVPVPRMDTNVHE